MSKLIKVSDSEKYIGKLAHGRDLLEEIRDTCNRLDVRFGQIEAIGAVQKARLAYYDQTSQKYEHFEINKPMEMASLIGSVSSKDGEPMVHAHVTLADKKGKTYGGHLATGTIIFAAEVVIQAFKEDPLERGKDKETGLPLWDMEG